MSVTAPTMEAHRRAALAVSEPLQVAAVALHHLVRNTMQAESLAIIADEALQIDATARKAVVAQQLQELSAKWAEIVELVSTGSAAMAAASADVTTWIEDHAQNEIQGNGQ